MALLRRFDLDPIVAVWPSTAEGAASILRRYEDAGLRPAVWPMLDDAEGRWVNADNLGAFTDYVERLADALAPSEMVLDLEPAIARVKASLGEGSLHFKKLSLAGGGEAFARARAALVALVDRLHARGLRVSAAVPAPVLLDSIRGPRPYQEQLGTPVDGPRWDHVSPMLYSSILEGWSRGALRRADARALTAALASMTRERHPEIGGASLGAVGVGAFGDEPVYRGPEELRDDVGLARAAGLDDLALFDLGGVLHRPPAEAWLEAFTEAPALPGPPGLTLRARALLGAARLAGKALSFGRGPDE